MLSLLDQKSHHFSSADFKLHFETPEICAPFPFISEAWVKLRHWYLIHSNRALELYLKEQQWVTRRWILWSRAETHYDHKTFDFFPAFSSLCLELRNGGLAWNLKTTVSSDLFAPSPMHDHEKKMLPFLLPQDVSIRDLVPWNRMWKTRRWRKKQWYPAESARASVGGCISWEGRKVVQTNGQMVPESRLQITGKAYISGWD